MTKPPKIDKLKKKGNVDGLIEVLTYSAPNNPRQSFMIHGDAAAALGEVGDTRAIDPILKAQREITDLVKMLLPGGRLQGIGIPEEDRQAFSHELEEMQEAVRKIRARVDDKFAKTIAVLDDAYLVRSDPELTRRVSEALDSIAASSPDGIEFLVRMLYKDMSLDEGRLVTPNLGDGQWNWWLQKREIVLALARSGAGGVAPVLEPLRDAKSPDSQFYEIMRPAVQEALLEIS